MAFSNTALSDGIKIDLVNPEPAHLERLYLNLKQSKSFLNNATKLIIRLQIQKLGKNVLKNLYFDLFNDLEPDILEGLINTENYFYLNVLLETKRSSKSVGDAKKKQALVRKLTVHELRKSTLQHQEFEDKLLVKILDKNCRKLAIWMVKYTPGFLFTENLIKHCINKNDYLFLKWLFKSFSKRVRKIILSESVFFKYIKQLDSDAFFLHSLNLIYSFRNERLSLYNIRILTEKFNGIFQENKPLLLNALSPVSVTVMISDLFLKLSRVNMIQSIKLEEVAKKYRGLAIALENKIDENLTLKHVLLTDIFPLEKKRPLIEILFDEREFFQDLLTNPVIVEIFKRKWYSSYRFDMNFLAGSSALCIMSSYDELIEQGGEKSKQKLVRTNQGLLNFLSENINVTKFIPLSNLSHIMRNNHIFQYIIYTHSAALRTMLEFIFFVAIFICIVSALMNYLVISEPVDMMRDDFIDILLGNTFPEAYNEDIQKNMLKFKNWQMTKENSTEIFFPKALSASSLPLEPHQYSDFCYNFLLAATQTKSLYDDYSKDCFDFVRFLSETPRNLPFVEASFYLIIFHGSFSFVQIFYYYLLHKKIRFTTFYIADVIICGCGVFCLYSGARSKRDAPSKDLFRELIPTIKICCTFTIFLLWIKFISYIKMTQSLGVLIKIIYLMVKDLLLFMVIVAFIYLSFGSIFFIMYQSYYPEYSTFWLSVRQMVAASMGGFTFYTEGTLFNLVSSSILTMLFLTLASIILLNLLIAILSNTYSLMISRSSIEYGFILYDSYKTQKFHKYYSAILLYPPPLSVISYVLLPFVVFFKSETLNQIILKIAYLLFFLVFFVIFNAFNIGLAIPLAYLFMIFKILFQDYIPEETLLRTKGSTDRTFVRFVHCCLWIFIGLPFLLKTHITHDLFIFCKSAFMKIDNREKLKSISFIDYRILKNIYKKGLRENRDSISKDEFFHLFSENLINAGLITKEKQDVVEEVESGLNNLLNFNQLHLINLAEGENEKRAMELEIMEAKDFINNFAINNEVKFSSLGKFFEVIKMKKRKTKGGVKKYPHLLEIANLEKARRACEDAL